MDQQIAEEIAIALKGIHAELKALREDWNAAPMQEINRKMLEQLKRQESGVAAPTLVFPGGKSNH
jgi:hypothetical protein